METLTFENDIKVFYVTATSYPGGIADAHKQLHALIPFSANRKYFGVSRPESEIITYRAAAEELREGEAEELHCDALILRKGKYSCITVSNYQQNIQGIGKAFDTILKNPNIDPNGYCVEWYFNDTDVRCMVRLENTIIN